MTSNTRFADLHIHTNHSDGYHSPEDIIEKVKLRGLTTIAITDHDEVSAVPAARAYGETRGIEVLTGVELSVSYRDYDLHLLGYCFDENHPEITAHMSLFKEERIGRAERIVEKLARLGMPISFDAVLEKAGHGTVGRPHIANVLIEDQFVYSFQEAFNKFLGTGKPAYVEKYKFEINDAIHLIAAAGGVCSVAHPGLQIRHEDLIHLIKLGVQGIEVVHPKHNHEAEQHYRELATYYGVLQTGGSDFHGGDKGEETLGQYKIAYSAVEQLKELAGGE